MNRETIIQMAREAGLAEVTDTAESLPADYVEALAKLCTLAVTKEREECAKVCEGLERKKWESIHELHKNGGRIAFDGPMQCAGAIRARGEA